MGQILKMLFFAVLILSGAIYLAAHKITVDELLPAPQELSPSINAG